MVGVMHDQQTIPRRLDVVLDPVTTRRHYPRLAQGRRRVEQPHLGGQLGAHLDDDPGVVARGPDAHPEALVRLLEHQDVILGWGADLVAPDLMRTPRLIHSGVEEVLPVQRPDSAIADRSHRVVDHGTGLDVLDPQGEALITLNIHGIGDLAPVGAHLEGPQREELMPLRLEVAVQQQLLTLGGDPRLELRSSPTPHLANPALRRILLALESARVVPPAPIRFRYRQVRLLGPGLDLVEDPRSQRLEMTRQSLGIGILVLQVRNDLRVVLVPKPLEPVNDPVAVVLTDVLYVFGGDRLDGAHNGTVADNPIRPEHPPTPRPGLLARTAGSGQAGGPKKSLQVTEQCRRCRDP